MEREREMGREGGREEWRELGIDTNKVYVYVH